MRATKILSVLLTCSLSIAGVLLETVPALAVIDSGTIAVQAPDGHLVESTVIVTMSIVTNTTLSRRSFIEIFFATDDGPGGLRLESKDQRRIEAFYDQILKATAAHQQFQITAYAYDTFPTNGYIANIDSGLTYFMLY